MAHRISLVVDDDFPVRLYIASILQQEEFRTGAGENSPQALQVFKALRSDVHVIVSDIQNAQRWWVGLGPDREESYPTLPIILVTGCPEPDAKFDGFLQKPFPPSALVATVRNAMAPLKFKPSSARLGRRCSEIGCKGAPHVIYFDPPGIEQTSRRQDMTFRSIPVLGMGKGTQRCWRPEGAIRPLLNYNVRVMTNHLMFCTDGKGVELDSEGVPVALTADDKERGQYYVDCHTSVLPVSESLARVILTIERYTKAQEWVYIDATPDGMHEFAVVELCENTITWIRRLADLGLRATNWTVEQEQVLRAAIPTD
jgi:CheY-like chemotaxis protein